MYQKEIVIALFIISALIMALGSYIEVKRIDELMNGRKRKDH